MSRKDSSDNGTEHEGPTPLVRSTSPFRYPGGKGFLTKFLADEIAARFGAVKPTYVEPYCGGAGAAINLLLSSRVERLVLNDADHRVYSAWRAMLTETDRFMHRLSRVKVDIKSWNRHVAVLCDASEKRYDFDVGFAAFFVNRTSRSGVILGSGPIGGYAQQGEWKINARFNKRALRLRIREIAKRRKEIQLSCEDGLLFCRNIHHESSSQDQFYFIDPPYVEAGGRLYYDGMTTAKHLELADWLKSGSPRHWVVTYDNHSSVRQNFRGLARKKIDVRYSLGRRRLEKELLYMSPQHAI
ncbi:DNA adenine methylase [Nostoc sp. XA013]|nr:DNA adenine methylase [Nostoc sp. XA013]